uniref:mandelate racemase/muconate lactonizing enzyme family protein n=1 Tax=Halovivax sp. TaxID=1935978 RepID=UPI0025C71141
DHDDSTYDHVIVRVETDAGVTGTGEIAPAAYWPHGLTQSACLTLVEDHLAPLVEGRNLNRIPRIVEDAERALAGEPFPLYGIDLALHDALGKARELPVYDLLGGPDGDPTIDLHYSIGIKDAESMGADAASAAENGFDAFKVKVGGDDPKAERAGLRAIRETVPDARIRVDANQAWTAEEAVREIRALSEAAGGLVLVEQPVAYDDIVGLRRVREAVEPAILADESCFSPRDAADIARRNAADILNIKLAKTGGLARGRDVATVADAHGLTCFVGSMVELGVGMAASAHFAAGTPTVTYPTGVLNSHAEHTLLKNADEWVPDGGTFTVPDRPGLGVVVDEDALERYRAG